MNAREGMQRLRAERRIYGMCQRCGVRLEKGWPHLHCPECLEKCREMYHRRKAKEREKQR